MQNPDRLWCVPNHLSNGTCGLYLGQSGWDTDLTIVDPWLLLCAASSLSPITYVIVLNLLAPELFF